jgi:hypothetical protein
MKAPVEGDPGLQRGRHGLRLGQHGVEPGDILGQRDSGCFRGHRALDQGARADHLEGAGDRVWHWRHGGPARLNDVDAGADLDPEAAFHLQRDQGLSHRGARHPELLRKLPLGGQTAAHWKLALVDELAKLIGDLAIEASRCENLERQARAPLRFSPGPNACCVFFGLTI